MVPVRGSPVTKMGRVTGTSPVLGMLRPGGFREQTRDQRATEEHPRHLAAERGERFVPRVRLEQYLEGLEVLVLAEICQARQARRRGMQVLGGADGGAFAHLVSRSVVVFAAVDVDALPGDRRRPSVTPGRSPCPRSPRWSAGAAGRRPRQCARRSARRWCRTSRPGARSTLEGSVPKCILGQQS